MKIKEFVAAHADLKDPAAPMLEELRRRQKALVDAKIQCVQFLTPVRGKDGIWDITISGNETELENLASLVEVCEGLVAEVRADIIEYSALVADIERLQAKQAQAAALLAKYRAAVQ